MTRNYSLLSIVAIATMLSISASAFAQATVQTDKQDYSPGETVLITGSGFQPGESVKLQVLHDGVAGDNETSDAHAPWYVTADENGNISATWMVPNDEDESGATLKLVADGQSSLLHAETMFTDATNSLSPRAGTTAGGTPVTITGSGFTSGASFAVRFGGTTVSATRVTSTTLTAVTPAHVAGSVDVTVVINGVDDIPLTNGYTYFCTNPANVVFTESMGTVATTTSIAAHETANGFDNDNYTMSGTGDMRSSSASSEYFGATAGANIFLTTTVGTSFQIAGINTSGLSNLELSFGIFKSTTASDGSDLIVEVSSDGILYTALSLARLPAGTGTAGWYYRMASGTIPAVADLRIRFKQAGTSTQYRIDDIRLTAAPQITMQPSGATRCAGGSVTFTVAATGSGLGYQWYKGSVAPGNEVGPNNSSYTISPITVGDAADYFVVVSGQCGPSVISNTATLSVDTQGPTIGGQGADATIDCTATPSFTPPTASDANSGSTVNELTSTTGDPCHGIYTKTWDAIDACGNHSATVTQTIIAIDTHAPTIGDPPLPTTIDCTATPSFTAPTAFDDCSSATVNIVGSSTSGNSCNRTYTLSWDATDACGNHSATVSQLITVRDTQPPTIGAAGDNATIECTASPTFTPPTATDACSGAMVNCISTTTSSGSCPGSISITKKWDATDACGNHSATVSQIITVQDTKPPTIGAAGDDATIECTATPGFTPPTASDACTGATVNCVSTTTASGSCPGSFSFTKKWDANDACGNHSATVSQTITVHDAQAPTILCHAGSPFVRSTNAGLCTYKISGTEFDARATDHCSSPTINWSASGATTISGTGSMADQRLNFGTNTIQWKAVDACGNTSTCSVIVNINSVATTATVTVSPSSQQYSDQVNFVASVAPYNCSGAGDIGGTVTFKVGTQTVGSAPVINGTATLANVALLEAAPPTGQVAPTSPGSRTVTACFAGTDANYTVTNPTTTLAISCEDARAYYTGVCYASTSSPTSSTATVTLSATIKDISAAPGDPNYDTYGGDIRNARVTFINRDNNTIIASNVPVGLVNTADLTIGTAVYNWNVNITGDAQQFTIGVIVNNYYCRNSSDDDAVITVAKPLPDLFITGGGYLVLTNSAGMKAGDPGTRNNFGFNVKYNNSQTNLQGNINSIFRRMESGVLRVYQVKGNSMTSLNMNTACPKTAIFNGKANIQDITNPLLPQSIEGNATLQVKISDMGEPGSNDRIEITVWNKSGGVWFASNWDGTKTIEQLVSGGNIKVHGGSACTATFTVAAGTNVQKEMLPASTPFLVKAHPNPTRHSFTVHVETNNLRDKIMIKVWDIAGRLTYTASAGGHSYTFGENFATGVYIVEVRQGDKRSVIKLIKQ